MKVHPLALAAPLLLASLALPSASAVPYDCIMPDVDCYVTCVLEETAAVPPHACIMGPGTPITYRDCPAGTNGPAMYVYGIEVYPCWR